MWLLSDVLSIKVIVLETLTLELSSSSLFSVVHQGGRRAAQTKHFVADCCRLLCRWVMVRLAGATRCYVVSFRLGQDGVPLERALTLSLRVACAGVSIGSRRTWPKREWRRREMVSRMPWNPFVSKNWNAEKQRETSNVFYSNSWYELVRSLWVDVAFMITFDTVSYYLDLLAII